MIFLFLYKMRFGTLSLHFIFGIFFNLLPFFNNVLSQKYARIYWHMRKNKTTLKIYILFFSVFIFIFILFEYFNLFLIFYFSYFLIFYFFYAICYLIVNKNILTYTQE